MVVEFDSQRIEEIRKQVETLKARVSEACDRCGRSPDEVVIVVVAKTYGPDAVRAVTECGLSVIGENRVQEARQKIPLCPGRIEWHMIGHLQRNKANLAVELFDMVHSVDSLRLLNALESAAGDCGKRLPVCLQVNVSGEASKFGMEPESVEEVLEAAQSCMHVEVVGLMTIPPFSPDAEDTRTYFRSLRNQRDRLADQTGFQLAELSMGMSNDFEVAIEEGATYIRVGSFIFGERR